MLDIGDREMTRAVAAETRPDIIVHVAAVASSKECEQNPAIANHVNVSGTANVVSAANECGSKLVYISTEFAAGPSDTLGETKLSGESAAMRAEAGWVIVRPVQLIGQSPNLNGRFQQQLFDNISKGTPAVYDNSEAFQVAHIWQLSRLVAMAANAEVPIYGNVIPLSTNGMRTKLQIAEDLFSHPILREHKITVSASGSKSTRKRIELPTTPALSIGIDVDYCHAIDATAKEIAEALRK